MDLLAPSQPTLKKYGLSLDDWQVIADRQGGVCAVCKKLPTTGRLCVDHFHAPRWKKLPPELRKTFVRGLLCWRCNTTFVGRGVNVAIALGVVDYLNAFETRSKMGPTNEKNKNRTSPMLAGF